MTTPTQLPVLPLRDLVLFPGVSMPIAVGRRSTLKALEAARSDSDKLVFAVAQRSNTEKVSRDGLHTVGTIAKIEQVQRSPAGIHVLLHGQARANAVRYEVSEAGHLVAAVRSVDDILPDEHQDPAFIALYREARDRAAELGHKSGLADDTVRQILAGIDDPGRLADLVAGYIDVPTKQRQELLETVSVEERLRRVLIQVQRQLAVLDAQADLNSKVKEELGDRQREMFLREQLKAIQQELGENADEDLDELGERLAKLDLSDEARVETEREMRRLNRIGRDSMEAQVIRTFLETIAELPWSKRSNEQLDQIEASKVLDEDHYGLADVKDRVLEFLAVRQLRGQAEEERSDSVAAESDLDASQESGDTKNSSTARGKAPILLFVGPPGVGKTSLAKSIARAMGREYVRISLGGARDEADIRGHRRTYVGAMAGRIIKGMKQAGTKNPVFLLDEVDKLGTSFQGDPASALLEVLDPAQNDSFTDNYLGVPFDLSEVFFVCTANFLQNIPSPLLDRMELIDFGGYTEGEKREIAQLYLVPRQLEENGLRKDQMLLEPGAIERVISEYTREAGVRQLERQIGALARKIARKIASGEVESVAVDREIVGSLLGRSKVHPEKMAGSDQIGVATGMYYTAAGGDIMFVEVSTMPGKGELVLTGQLGDVMKESARAAWSYARSHARALHIDAAQFDRDVHVHVPAGAIPKDGPSAGVSMAAALVSSLSGRPARHDLAMTGEITLSGRVLAIGGVKEKILGGVRAGIRTFVLPADNKADLDDLTAEVRAEIEVVFASQLGEVLALALRDARFQKGRLLFGDQQPEDVVPLASIEN